MTQAERALKALYEDFDWSGTKRRVMEQTVDRAAIDAAIDAGLIEDKTGHPYHWLLATAKGTAHYSDKLKPKPKVRPPKMAPRDPDTEEVLIRARIGVELLQKARNGGAALEVRQTLKQIAHRQLESFWTLKVTNRYEAEYQQINSALTELI